MFDSLTILGGGGWFPAQDRHTACAVLRAGDSAILIDAGTGVGRLAERPELLAGVRKLDIVLTHFHLDHICGLAYLPGMDIAAETTIWGPGLSLYDTPTSTLLDSLAREPFHPVPFSALHIETRDLPRDELEVSGVRIGMRRQPRHSAPSLGLRFNDTLTWITDTAYDPGSAPFAAGSELLAHEAWFTSDRPRNPDIHSSAAQAAQVAIDAEVDRLLLIHLPPFQAGIEPLLREARLEVPGTEPAIDGADVLAQAGTTAG
jgi:ribonuclease BN (tRNA processing enzyme)